MAKNPLYDLYEKLYFHEIEVREKLGGRLQTPMAIIVSLIGVLAFLIQNFDSEHLTTPAMAFLILLILSTVVLVVAIYFFVRSWYGNTYDFLPSADDTEQYRQLLQKTYEQYKDGDVLAEEYLYEYLCSNYIKCATQNTQCNDKRSLNIHKMNGTVIISTVLIALSVMVFFLGDIDKSKTNRPTEVVIIKPVDVKGAFMTDKKSESQNEVSLPPPPPPPPIRQIKEGVEIIKPQQEKKDDK